MAIEKILLESIRDITSYARSRESEFVELAKRIFALSITMDKEKEDSLNAELFLNIVKKYTDTNELTAGVLREFVEKVYVYHPEKVDGQKTQCIKSVWNCIGEFTTPQAK